MPDGSSMNSGQPRKLHPGAGRRRGNIFPKGRQVDPASLEEVRRLTSASKLDRDFLIENLHLIQDQYGSLNARHLAALAELMRLALAEVYEVATFMRTSMLYWRARPHHKKSPFVCAIA